MREQSTAKVTKPGRRLREVSRVSERGRPNAQSQERRVLSRVPSSIATHRIQWTSLVEIAEGSGPSTYTRCRQFCRFCPSPGTRPPHAHANSARRSPAREVSRLCGVSGSIARSAAPLYQPPQSSQ